MGELLYRDDTHRSIGICMEIHRERGTGYDAIIDKDAFAVELNCAALPFAREKKFEVKYEGVVLPHSYLADFVISDKILFEAKAVEQLADAPVKQVFNYPAASKLRPGLLVNFGADSLEWKRVVL